MADDLESKARALYEAGHSVRPKWEQLGETTKGVWKGYVLSGSFYIDDQQGDQQCSSTESRDTLERPTQAGQQP